MVYIRKVVLLLQLIPLLTVTACNLKEQSIETLTYNAKKTALLEKYYKIPHDEILNKITGNRLYTDLQELYKNHLITLKNETGFDSTLLIVAVISARVGKLSAAENTYGIPYITTLCDNLNLKFVDYTPQIAAKDPTTITQIAEESIWNKEGAIFIADLLADIIRAYDGYTANRDFTKLNKPATFGDLPPGYNGVIDEGESLSYKLKVNKQGLRMDYDLTFPKKKQRILLLGDGKIMAPYLDNEYTPSAILQRNFPDKEIINAGVDNYNMDDFGTLYREKARYTEPDIVIVCTDGGDILEEYFTQRNRHSRSKKLYLPGKMEEDFYNILYGTKEH